MVTCLEYSEWLSNLEPAIIEASHDLDRALETTKGVIGIVAHLTGVYSEEAATLGELTEVKGSLVEEGIPL